MSKESSSSWFYNLSPTTRATLIGGGIVAAALTLGACEPQNSKGEKPTTSASATVVENQDVPSCTGVTISRHAHHPDEITFGIEGETTDRVNFDLHGATFVIDLGGNRTQTIHSSSAGATYTFPGAGTYDVNASFSIDVAPNDPDAPAAPKGGSYECPQIEVTIP